MLLFDRFTAGEVVPVTNLPQRRNNHAVFSTVLGHRLIWLPNFHMDVSSVARSATSYFRAEWFVRLTFPGFLRWMCGFLLADFELFWVICLFAGHVLLQDDFASVSPIDIFIGQLVNSFAISISNRLHFDLHFIARPSKFWSINI